MRYLIVIAAILLCGTSALAQQEKIRPQSNGNLVVRKNAFIQDSITVSNNAIFLDSINVRKSALVQDSLRVFKNTTIDQRLTVGDNAHFLDSINVRKSALVQDSLRVFKNTTIDQRLTVGDNAHFLDSINVRKSALVQDSLRVFKNTTIDQRLTVGDNAHFLDSINVRKSALVQDSLRVFKNTTIDQRLTVGDNAHFLDSINVRKSALVQDSLRVFKNTTIDQRLTVGDNAHFLDSINVRKSALVQDSLRVFKNTTIDQRLTVGDNAHFLDSINVKESALLQANLTVKQLTTVDTLSVTKGVKIGDGLDVDGQTQLDTIMLANLVQMGDFFMVERLGGRNDSAHIGNLDIFRDSTVVKAGKLVVKNNLFALDKFSIGVPETFANAGLSVIDPGDKYAFLFNLEDKSKLSHFRVSPGGQVTLKTTQIRPTPSPAGHAFQLTSAGHGISVSLDTVHSESRFMTFYQNRTAFQRRKTIGKISPTTDASGAPNGLQFESGSGDYAEWLERKDHAEMMSYGDIVGVEAGKISKQTEHADHFMVVSQNPIVLGNMPEASIAKSFEMVGFMGQVKVKVEGVVKSGDYILPSGHHNGVGRAVSPHQMRVEDYHQIVGVAWESSAIDGVKLINTAIGINTNDLTHIIVHQQRELDRLSKAVSDIQAILGMSKEEAHTKQPTTRKTRQ